MKWYFVESSPISVRCFTPGITSIPTLPTPSLETTTAGYVYKTTATHKPETTTSTKTTTTSTNMPSTQTSDYPSVSHPVSIKTTQTGFTEQMSFTVTTIHQKHTKSTSVPLIPETVSTTTTSSEKKHWCTHQSYGPSKFTKEHTCFNKQNVS